MAKGSLGWRHRFGTTVPSAQPAFASNGVPFVVHGTPIARDAAALELGVDGEVWRNARLGVAYTGELASRSQDHGIDASFQSRF